ncbi:rhodanese-related sulfurtransferase [Thioclava sp. GXIMD2076]|uniref:oxygen-dependent tRNA uridine(34) hydroxylase TrhO n=1 Tax=Thioclava sp. GXIMD2076 TaxID=3131931 RepID=UPI0030CB4EFC
MYIVAALYHFTRFDDLAAIRGPLLALAQEAGVKGTLLLAHEGINGTIAGPREGIDAVLAHVRALPGCAGLDWKESTAEDEPFLRMKVKLKKEIVTMGQPDVDPTASVGNYCTPEEWNELIQAPDVVVIDTRNDYEVDIGTFKGAVDPKTKTFRDFPKWWEENRERFHNKRVAMFCTGGIRCEKSTNYLIGQGVEDVYHLKGGILKYLEEMPKEESLWEGDCFVFDGRVALTHGLDQGKHREVCHACRRPLAPEDRQRPEFEQGVQCHHCVGEYSEEDRARFREREHQIQLAKARGERHIGRDETGVM